MREKRRGGKEGMGRESLEGEEKSWRPQGAGGRALAGAVDGCD